MALCSSSLLTLDPKQIVKGLGETLVGAYPGRALSFVAKKSDIKNPKVWFYLTKFSFYLMLLIRYFHFNHDMPSWMLSGLDGPVALAFYTVSLVILALFRQVLGYPSKRVGLFIKQSIIFRSDSNGEDLEGYAGAGLYDRFVFLHGLF